MNHAHVEEGETFLMGRGDMGELGYASGLYRAAADLDLGVLQAEFLALNRVPAATDEVALLIGEEEEYRCHRLESCFQEWLLERGHVERVACKLLIISADIVPKSGGSGHERVISSSVEDPIPDVTDARSPAFR